MLPFFALKALSFLPGGALLKNPKVIIGIIIVALLVFGYFKWKSSIKQAIYNQIYTEQAEQHIENQRQEMERRQELMNESNRAVRAVQEQRAKLLREIETARQATRNVDPERNGEVAPVLQDALEFIRSRQSAAQPAPAPERSFVDRALDKVRGAPESEEETEPADAPAGAPAVSTGNSAIDAWRAKQKAKK